MKKYPIKRIALLVLMVILNACGVSKDIQYPQDSLPENFRTVATDSIAIESGATKEITVAQMPWQAFFSEEQLLHLIDQALLKNNQLQLAVKNLEIAQQQWQQAKWANLPELALNAQVSRNRPSENSTLGLNLNQSLQKNHIEDYSLHAGLSWEADIWGKIKNEKKEAFSTYLQTQEAHKAVQTALVAEVAKGYYNLLMLDYQLVIAKKNAALSEHTQSILEWQYQAGQVTSLAVAQAEAQKLNAQKLIPIFEQQILIQENVLSTLTGTFPTSIERSFDFMRMVKDENLQIGLPAELVSNRPDVKQAELMLDIENARVGIAKAAFYPTLRISATAGINSFETSNWFTLPASLFGTIAGGLTQPLLQGRRIKTQYQIALISREKAVIHFRESVLLAVSEVSNALVSLDKLQSQHSFLQNRTEILEKAIQKSTLLFDSGLATYLEVIVSQTLLLESELELAQNKRDQLAARVDLYRSLGGGWH
ncbi:efflux transporter outer membrane subunit [Myroides odoratus]|uniref:efflux transporter outer membrane subunit n=1 Tax=Myroides odoratus TaxID=256 RepID=UPI0039B080A7